MRYPGEEIFAELGVQEGAKKYPQCRDVYVLLACKVLNVRPSEVSVEQRAAAKAMNYARLYSNEDAPG